MMLYLANQTESVSMFHDERCEMGFNQHVPLLGDLHKKYCPHLRMGIKVRIWIWLRYSKRFSLLILS